MSKLPRSQSGPHRSRSSRRWPRSPSGSGSGTPSRSSGRIRRCSSGAAAGARFDELELNTYPSGGPVIVTNSARAEAEQRADRLRKLTGADITADEVLDSPHIFIGSLDGLTQKFVELRERFGISSFMVGGIDELAPVVERLAGR
jgi:hypothetical protein